MQMTFDSFVLGPNGDADWMDFWVDAPTSLPPSIRDTPYPWPISCDFVPQGTPNKE
jgi:hypothetical protein